MYNFVISIRLKGAYSHLKFIIMLFTVSPEMNLSFGQVLEKLINFAIDAGKDILVAILIYVIGRIIIKYIGKLVSKILEKRRVEISVQTFLKSLLKILLNLILAFAIIGKLGVETTSFAVCWHLPVWQSVWHCPAICPISQED